MDLQSLDRCLGVHLMRLLSVPDRTSLARTCSTALSWWADSFDGDTYGSDIPHRIVERTGATDGAWLTLVKECYENGVRLHEQPGGVLSWECNEQGESVSGEKTLMLLARHGRMARWDPITFSVFARALEATGRPREAAEFSERHKLTLRLSEAITTLNVPEADKLFGEGAHLDIHCLKMHRNGLPSQLRRRFLEAPAACEWLADRLVRQHDGKRHLASLIGQWFFEDERFNNSDYLDTIRDGYIPPQLRSMRAMICRLPDVEDVIGYFRYCFDSVRPRVKQFAYAVAEHPSLHDRQGDSILDALGKGASSGLQLDGRDYLCAAKLHAASRCTEAGYHRFLETVKKRVATMFSGWPQDTRLAIQLPTGESLQVEVAPTLERLF